LNERLCYPKKSYEGYVMPIKTCEKVGYCRVSRDEQNPDNQKRILIENGVMKACIFVDHGLSGTRPAYKRAGFNQLMEYIENHKGEVKYLYVFEISRIGRSMLETFNVINDLEKNYGVKVWSLSENEAFTRNEEKSIRDLLLAVFSWVAERERDNIVSRTKLGLERARAEGKQIGRKAISLDEKKILDLREAGTQWKDIAQELGVTTMTMYRYRRDHGLLAQVAG
jgi:putative DNA-invertase from lambdoid prophage Rac